MIRSTFRAIVVGIVAVAVLALLIASKSAIVGNGGAAKDMACGSAHVVAFPDASFTPYASMRSHPEELPLAETGQVVSSVGDSRVGVGAIGVRPTLGGKSETLVVVSGGEAARDSSAPPEVRVYYGPADAADMTIDEFLGKGGLVATESSTSRHDASYVLAAVGSRAVEVRVGRYAAAMVHADPLADGTRPYGIYWADGERDLSLVSADFTAQSLMQVAASFYCG